ncbi:SDR family oxidoreductase [Acetobacter oeni]|uniref:Short-chain dehydrogenase/reductase n=1 Tax=Acetobacter oeni TaxID=304077 RepID=A0A511XJS5_9PROT|nr:SDR family oxidoreductase [Acetobacter oeni]MBB3883426.1 short-subunit dehydrogenase [Acetobacter oeni]NHO19398.1 SDR family oxidoreductase [Acetobacter oeni]GBR03994.1 short chain dehydrogenase [Acetobacter oeni LMG 21952]GEN63207.1 short-chain dehydrogenase/reductase [Acetobacter oeni]
MTTGHILITGAGTGFGQEVALRLAESGHRVIAGVEIAAQVRMLQETAKSRNATLQVEKLDVTDPGDRQKAQSWDVEVLLNNAGISEGGSMVDIPAENLRRQFEVNVIGPVMLTQGLAKKMVKRRKGKIVFMSSVAGLTVDPFSGAYSASKHAIEAMAEALYKELREFGIEVATINPGPFLTGFNDRMFEAWKSWLDDPATRLFDYEKIAFPHEQYDPEPVFETTIGVLTGKIALYRNVEPKEIIDQQKSQLAGIWDRRYTDDQGTRSDLVQKAYDIRPGTHI